MDEATFSEMFTDDSHVVFAFHGYAEVIHHLIHGRPQPGRFHVRGFQEQGTTTTPFDMVVLNDVSRYQLAMEAVRRSRRVPQNARTLIEHCESQLQRHHTYVRDHLEDMPEIRDWKWEGSN
jgi:xylulose-5-phosphate/fructose-6-phosphate phosphoketolase